MCGLFGFLTYGQEVAGINNLVEVLGKNSASRGTDATGIAYVLDGKIQIDKAPVSAYKFRYSIPQGTKSVMGHTRRTTQGNEKNNYNNHPFKGACKGTMFALAHNGILNNDRSLRQTLNLPATKVETDSYIAVQLLEQYAEVNAQSLKQMGELIEGMFTFTILDTEGRLSIVRKDSPFIIAHFKELQFYVYASTENILMASLMAWSKTFNAIVDTFKEQKLTIEFIEPKEGDIVIISPNGDLQVTKFTPVKSKFASIYETNYSGWGAWPKTLKQIPASKHAPSATISALEEVDEYYYAELKRLAESAGLSEPIFECLLEKAGAEEVEDALYANSIDSLLVRYKIYAKGGKK